MTKTAPPRAGVDDQARARQGPQARDRELGPLPAQVPPAAREEARVGLRCGCGRGGCERGQRRPCGGWCPGGGAGAGGERPAPGEEAEEGEEALHAFPARSDAEQGASFPPPSPLKEASTDRLTPVRPPPPPAQIDLQLESGEYFLKPREKQQRDEARRAAKQAQVVAGRKDERAQAFVAPEEGPARAVVGSVGDAVKKDKKKRKREE